MAVPVPESVVVVPPSADVSDGELSVPTTPRTITTATKMKEAMDYKFNVDTSILRLRSSDHGNNHWRIAISIVLWFLFSTLTSLTNKFILSTRNGDPNVLAMAQILTTTLLGGIKLNTRCCLNQYIHARPSPDTKPANFIRNMALVGIMRFVTVVLGLISLKNVAVSFMETIKSSAPLFTVLFAWVMLNEKTGLYVNLSLIPLTAGLALCSATEIGFNMLGFLAAVSNNIVDCMQNVFSKKLLSGEHYTPVELQFYTSFAAALIQIPFWLYNDFHMDDIVAIDSTVAIMMVLNSLAFHLQSVIAYVLMAYISPVSHSVANTAKRAVLILLSILIFHNPVTVMNVFGILLVFLGVVLYNRAREHEKMQETHTQSIIDKV